MNAFENCIAKDYEITAKQCNCAKEPAVTQFDGARLCAERQPQHVRMPEMEDF